MLIFVINIRPARTFWNSTHCLLSPFTLEWSRNLWHYLMWNMAVNNISYPIYPLSTRTVKGYFTKMIPFFFCSVYIISCLDYSKDQNTYTTQKKFRISCAYFFVLSTSNSCRLWRGWQIKVQFSEDVSCMTISNFCEKQFVLNDTTLNVQKPLFWPQNTKLH